MITIAFLLLLFQVDEKPATEAKEEPKPAAKFVDRVAVKVNDKIITERELLVLYRQRRQGLMQDLKGAELDRKLQSAWKDTLENTKENLLLFEKAVELDMVPTDDEVKGRLKSIQESYGLSDVEFEQALYQQTGFTMSEHVADQKRQQAANTVIQTQIYRRIQVEDSELAMYYDENIKDFMTSEKYRIAEIVLLKEESGAGAASFKAKTVLESLKQGDDFAEVARTYSDSLSKENGGDLGDVEYGDLNPLIEEKARELQPGGFSEILETENAYFIIKLLDRTPAKPKAFDTVKEEIRNRLVSPRLAEKVEMFLEELRSTYLLEVMIDESKPPELN